MFKPNSFVNFVNGRYTLFEIDKEWKSDKLYQRLLYYLDLRTSQKFYFGVGLASCVGAKLLSPYFLVICCLCFRKLINNCLQPSLINRPFSVVINKIELHENGYQATIMFSSEQEKTIDLNQLDLCDPQ